MCNCQETKLKYDDEGWNRCFHLIYGGEIDMMNAIMGVAKPNLDFVIPRGKENNTNCNKNTNKNYIPTVEENVDNDNADDPRGQIMILENDNTRSTVDETTDENETEEQMNNNETTTEMLITEISKNSNSNDNVRHDRNNKMIQIAERSRRGPTLSDDEEPTPVRKARICNGVPVRSKYITTQSTAEMTLNEMHVSRQNRINKLNNKNTYNRKHSAKKQAYEKTKRPKRKRAVVVKDPILVYYRKKIDAADKKMKYYLKKKKNLSLLPEAYIQAQTEKQKSAEDREIYKILVNMVDPSQVDFIRERFIEGYDEKIIFRDFLAQKSAQARDHFTAAVIHSNIATESKKQWLEVIDDKDLWNETFDVDINRRIPAESYQINLC